MTFFKSHQKLHIWLLADLVLLAALLDRPGAPGLDERPGALCIRPDPEISGQPVLSGLLLCDGGAVCPGGRPRAGLCGMEHHGGSQGQRAAGSAGLTARFWGRSTPAERLQPLPACCGGCAIITDTFQDRSGIRAEEVSLPDLTAVTAWFAENLAQTADQVPRDEAGTFNASLNEIFAGSTDIYQGAEDLFPFLEFEDRVPKRMFFSRVMSAMTSPASTLLSPGSPTSTWTPPPA